MQVPPPWNGIGTHCYGPHQVGTKCQYIFTVPAKGLGFHVLGNAVSDQVGTVFAPGLGIVAFEKVTFTTSGVRPPGRERVGQATNEVHYSS